MQARELRNIMGHLATGVTVVTTHDGDGRHTGLTASAVCSLSLTPALVLVCIDKRAESHPLVERSRVFAVNILGEGQQGLAERFATSGGDKFAGVAYHVGVTGAPVLEHTLGHVECRVVATHEGGDHTVFIGQAESGGRASGRPLLYFNGRYRGLDVG